MSGIDLVVWSVFTIQNVINFIIYRLDNEVRRQLELAYLNATYYAVSICVEKFDALNSTLQLEQSKLNEQRKVNHIEMQNIKSNINHLSVFMQRLNGKK